MKTIIDAMKQALTALSDLPLSALAYDKINQHMAVCHDLKAAIAHEEAQPKSFAKLYADNAAGIETERRAMGEEAQTVEPVALVKWNVGGLVVHIVGDVKEGDQLFTRTAPPPSVEQSPSDLLQLARKCGAGTSPDGKSAFFKLGQLEAFVDCVRGRHTDATPPSGEREALIKRLRNGSNWLIQGYGNFKDCVSRYDRAPFEAADMLAADAKQVIVPEWLFESTKALALHMARKFYPEVPQFEALDDLAGVISQIDNMTTGLKREAQQVAVPNRRNTKGLRDIDRAFGAGWNACRAAMLAAAPQPPQAERVPMTDEQIEAAWNALQKQKADDAAKFLMDKAVSDCGCCDGGVLFVDSNGYSSFMRCKKCGHVPLYLGGIDVHIIKKGKVKP